jgi:hypothetical protein
MRRAWCVVKQVHAIWGSSVDSHSCPSTCHLEIPIYCLVWIFFFIFFYAYDDRTLTLYRSEEERVIKVGLVRAVCRRLSVSDPSQSPELLKHFEALFPGWGSGPTAFPALHKRDSSARRERQRTLFTPNPLRSSYNSLPSLVNPTSFAYSTTLVS